VAKEFLSGIVSAYMDIAKARQSIGSVWRDSIVHALVEYVRIPNQSPAFDPDWEAHGHMQRAVALITDWIGAQHVDGLSMEVVTLPGRTPVIVAEVPGSGAGNILLYGHLDKQPPMEGWSDGLGPWTPVLRDGRLYGRGGADDGYAAFASIAAIRELQRQKIPHARCVVLIEACEESGSPDLPAYIEALANRIGRPDLVVCLDSGCGTYDQLWVTTSLRGEARGVLRVSTLTEGVHSGAATGIVPSTFRIARLLLSRLEDPATGEMLLPELHCEIPDEREKQIEIAAGVLGDRPGRFPFAEGTRPVADDAATLLRNRTWRPGLEVIGARGLPALETAGNVLRPVTELKISVRLPPTVQSRTATAAIKRTLEADPPYGASVSFDPGAGADGWNAPAEEEWLTRSLDNASQAIFGSPACAMGEGGTIPFMGMLGEKFPQAQFVITGVLGPQSNAHGPNEFLHLKMAENLTVCIAQVIADQQRTK
jgi:acetylornithine deacetylase/succinyl-diaminopimelate desuccinylase-like protein